MLAAIVVLVLLIVIYLLFVLPTQWLKVEIVERAMKVKVDMTVLQVSDLHVERLRVSPERLARIIKGVNPDFIALTGDYMDRRTSFPSLEKYLRIFEESGKPCFAVLGNHDYHLQDAYLSRMLVLFRQHGIRLLRNEAFVYQGLQLVGIDDACTWHDDEDKAFRGVNPNLPIFVITHDPNLVLSMTHRYDYLISGHLHGKQFRLPFLFSLQPMGPLPKTGVYQGTHETELGAFYISKGIGQSGFNARFLVRSEVTVHRLRMEKT